MVLKSFLIPSFLVIVSICWASSTVSGVFVKSILVRNNSADPIIVRFVLPNGNDVKFNEPGVGADSNGVHIAANTDITKFFLSQLLSAYVNHKSVDVTTEGLVGACPKLYQIILH